MIPERTDLDFLERILSRAWQLEGQERDRYLDSCLGTEGRLRRQAAALISADSPPGGAPVEDVAEAPVPAEPLGDGADPSETAEDPPRFVGAYRLGELLGEGGMGSVYRAVRSDDEYRKEVAVKLLRRENVTADLVQRFRRERQILAALNHPNIARLLDGGTTEDGLPYLVMELVRGEPIDRYCEGNRISLPTRLALIRTVCLAAQAAHQNLVVHRDLKPSNILVTPSGHPMLLDFGIAKFLNPSFAPRGSATTKAWNRILTPDYASPEQLRDGIVGVNSDVYSIGVMLFQLLTGELPERAQHLVSETELTLADHHIVLPSEAFRKLQREDPELAGQRAAARGLKADSLRRYLAGDLDRIVAKALHPVPKLRYASADRLAEDLQFFEAGLPISARNPHWIYRTQKFLHRNRIKATLGLAVVLSLFFLGWELVDQKRELAAERDLARLERDKAREISSFLESLFTISDPFGVATMTGETVSREASEEVLDLGARRVHRELGDRPELRAAILNRIGRTFGALGYTARAEELLRSALETREAWLGPDHPETAESLSDLGEVVRFTDSPDKAEPLFRRAIEIRRRALGPSLELAGSLRGLAKAMSGLGKSDEAVALATEAWTMSRELGAETDEEVLDTLVVYAAMLSRAGELERAASLLEEGLERVQGLEGPQKIYRSHFNHELAATFFKQGKAAAAEPLFRQALEDFETMFGPENGMMASALGNLGVAVRDQGRLEEAEDLLKQALEMTRRIYGAHHPKVVSRLNNLAGLASRRNQLERAAALYDESLAVAEESLPQEHLLWANIRAGAGYAQVLLGRPEQGEAHLRRALAQVLEARGEGDWRVAYYRLSLGHCRLEQEDLEEARRLIEGTLEKIFATRPRAGGERQRALQVHVALYQRLQEPGKVAQYREALAAETTGGAP